MQFRLKQKLIFAFEIIKTLITHTHYGEAASHKQALPCLRQILA
jgi:hypothetical protein